MVDSIDIKMAQEALKAAFPFTEKATQYIATYRTTKGREIALDRESAGAIYVWVSKCNTSLNGVSVKNEKYPGEPYGPRQARNSNLNDTNAPTLKVGNRVWHLKVDNHAALEALVVWYKEA